MLILIAGDSLALPRPDNFKTFNPLVEKDLAVNYQETYGHLMQERLGKAHPEQNIIVANRSQRSFTIKHIFNQFSDHLYVFRPDVTILHAGLVDCWLREELQGRQYVVINEFQRYYENIIKHVRNRPETKLIVVGICPTSHKMEGRYPGILGEISKYNKVLCGQADNKQVFFVDMARHVSPQKLHTYLLPDDQHLNKVGHRLVARELCNMVQAFIINEQGAAAYNDGSMEQAYQLFKQSYEFYPLYIDNIHNLLGLAYHLEDGKYCMKLVGMVKRYGIKDPMLNELVAFINTQVPGT